MLRTRIASLLLLAHAAIASADPRADRVVGRYVEVTGGRAALDSVRTLYVRSRVEGFGFQGTNETWSARPDRRRARTQLGPFDLVEGMDGAAAWRTDPTTKKIVRLEGREADDARSDAWYEWDRWAVPGGGGRVTWVGARRDSAGAYSVLRVTPPIGRERTMWFDDATGLLARSESQSDANTFLTTYGDWRVAGGRRRAHRVETQVVGMPMNRLSAHVDSAAANVALAGVSFAPPDSTGIAPVRWLGTPGVARLPFDDRTRHVWLRASVNGGPPEDFLFDTGASITVLDSTWAARQGIATSGQMQAAGAGASGSASFARVASLRVLGAGNGGGEGVELDSLRVAVMSVSPAFRPYFWRDFAGVIGYDVISRFVVTLDYDRRIVELHDPAAFQPPRGVAPLTLVLDGPVPAVEAEVDGHAGLFRLDVGSSSTVDLHTPFVREHGFERRLRGGIITSGAGFGGVFENRIGRLSRFRIGPHAWRDPLVTLSRASEGAFASRDFAGNIGNRLLARFRVTLDYEGRRLWLEPGARARSRDALTSSGLMLGREGDRVVVHSVLAGSPAEQAGLEVDDIITELDGRAIGEWDLPQVEALLERGTPGRDVPLAWTRDGAAGRGVMRLREVMP